MTLAMIVAHDPNLVIGKNNTLPWYYSKDLKYFKRITIGHPILMGRGVFESINENPLPGRENIVLSRNRQYDQVRTFSNIDQALAYLKDEALVFIIGGGSIYRQMFDRTDKLYVTEVHQSYEGDTTFPEYRNEIGITWKEIKRDDNEELSFVIYERIKGK